MDEFDCDYMQLQSLSLIFSLKRRDLWDPERSSLSVILASAKALVTPTDDASD